MAMLFDLSKQNKKFITETTFGFLPKKVLIPLCQESDFEAESIVKPGDTVKEGQVIAEVSKEFYGKKSFGASKIHSSIPGIVQDIKICSFPNGKQGKAVEILLNGSFSHLGNKKFQTPTFDWQNYSPALLLRSISDAGVVNTFFKANCSSLEIEINKIRDEQNKKLFVRLFDDDSSCQADLILSRAEFDKIITGLCITAKICEAEEVVIAYSINDFKALNKKNSKAKFTLTEAQQSLFGDIKIQFLPINTKNYPSSGQRQLISSYFKQNKIIASNSKFAKHTLFTDSLTMLNVYNAVVLNIPVEYNYIYVTGNCLLSSALLKVPIGTSFKEIALQCGGFVKKLGRIIVNGQINGVAINSLETPSTKYVKSIEFSSTVDSYDKNFGMCIHCGKCRDKCKINLCPDLIYSKVIFRANIDQVYVDAVDYCSECGVCSTVCPSKLPLAQVVRLLKYNKY